MKALLLVSWLALGGAVLAQSPDALTAPSLPPAALTSEPSAAPSGPVTAQEAVQLYKDLGLPQWVSDSQRSNFDMARETGWFLNGPSSRRWWKGCEARTADFLARPPGAATPLLKLLSDFESRVDGRQKDGTPALLADARKEFDWLSAQ